MKGVIVMCLQDLVTSSAGQKVWKQILAEALDDEFAMFVAGADVDDARLARRRPRLFGHHAQDRAHRG
jgi:hypothetical protein